MKINWKCPLSKCPLSKFCPVVDDNLPVWFCLCACILLRVLLYLGSHVDLSPSLNKEEGWSKKHVQSDRGNLFLFFLSEKLCIHTRISKGNTGERTQINAFSICSSMKLQQDTKMWEQQNKLCSIGLNLNLIKKTGTWIKWNILY